MWEGCCPNLGILQRDTRELEVIETSFTLKFDNLFKDGSLSQGVKD